MIVEFLEITFSRHDTCKLRCDTSLALARSSPTRRYSGTYCRRHSPLITALLGRPASSYTDSLRPSVKDVTGLALFTYRAMFALHFHKSLFFEFYMTRALSHPLPSTQRQRRVCMCVRGSMSVHLPAQRLCCSWQLCTPRSTWPANRQTYKRHSHAHLPSSQLVPYVLIVFNQRKDKVRSAGHFPSR